MENLPIGTRVNLSDGSQAEIVSKLGEGGQGVVYMVRLDSGKDKAFKCYTKKMPYSFIVNLRGLIAQNPPSLQFLWPHAIVTYNGETCGYIMDLRPQGYHDLSDFYSVGVEGKLKAEFESYAAMLQAAINICSAFRQLHISGYSYIDLNDGNILINPKDGKVLICDNDNICPNNSPIRPFGKPRYVAPEVLGGDNPNINSDRFSLAIILYRLFMLDHPFEGESTLRYPCLTTEISNKIYGKEAIFVYDQNNATNRPNPQIHKNSVHFWQLCPQSLQQMFQKALSYDAILDPSRRVTSKEWKDLFLELRRKMIVCPNEINHKFHDFIAYSILNQCPICSTKIVVAAAKLNFDNGVEYVVTDRKNVYIADNMEPIALCHYNTKRKRLGLKNIRNEQWTIIAPSGKVAEVASGETIVLKDEMTISFSPGDTCKVKLLNNM